LANKKAVRNRGMAKMRNAVGVCGILVNYLFEPSMPVWSTGAFVQNHYP
jgi:hypothetical protein